MTKSVHVVFRSWLSRTDLCFPDPQNQTETGRLEKRSISVQSFTWIILTIVIENESESTARVFLNSMSYANPMSPLHKPAWIWKLSERLSSRWDSGGFVIRLHTYKTVHAVGGHWNWRAWTLASEFLNAQANFRKWWINRILNSLSLQLKK